MENNSNKEYDFKPDLALAGTSLIFSLLYILRSLEFYSVLNLVV